MGCWKCLRVTGVLVVGLAIAIGSGLQGYYDLGLVLSPVMRVAFNSGLMDNVMLKEVSDGIHPPFRCVGVTQAHFDKLRSWRPQQDDVIVATFPKAGTHLFGQLVVQTLNDGEAEFESLHHALVTLEFANINPQDCNDSKIMNATNYKALAPTRRGVIVTHFPSQAAFFPGHKHIVVCRHPQDIIISFTNMLESFLGPAAPDVYGAHRMASKFSLGWATFYKQWWNLSKKHPNDVLFLFYEDVVADLPAAIRRVAKFLHHSIAEETVEKVAVLSGIAYMKKNSHKFDAPAQCQGGSRIFKSRSRKMINNGTAGRGLGLPEDLKSELQAQVESGLTDSDFPLRRYYPIMS